MRENEENNQYKDKVDIETIFMRQIERCLEYAGTQFFAQSVTALQKILPPQSYLRIEDKEDMWRITRKALKYKRNRGVKMGKPDVPLLFDSDQPVRRFEDGRIDWSDPNIISPVLIEETIDDYQLLFQIICEEAYNIGLLWSLDSVTKVDYVKSNIKPKRRPRRLPE